MISYLKGRVLAKAPDSIILSAGSIGYKVFLAAPMLAKASEGQELELFCSLYIRQDEALELYGMPTFQQLQLFEVLRGVSGIGPKAVLAISSLGTLDQLKNAIEKNDESFFKGIHGVGAKKIQKIILELTGKIKKFAVEKHVDDDAVHGLVALGFSRQRAREALSVVSSDIVDVQERMKQALKILAKK